MGRLKGVIGFLLLGLVFSCHRSSGLITAETNGLISIQLPQPEGVFMERADVSVRCIDCQPNETQRRNLVNVDTDIDQIPVAFINDELGRYRFTRGSLLSIDATYYDGEQAVMQTCAGESQGCRNHVYQIQGSDPVIRLDVRFEVVQARGTEDENIGEEELNENTISDGLAFTGDASRAFGEGYCLADFNIGGIFLGRKPGQFFSEVCLIPYENEIHVVNQGLQFVASINQEKFDLAWVAPILLEGEIQPDSYRPVVVGQEIGAVSDLPLFVCRDRENSRYGQTSLREDGSGRFLLDCFVSIDVQGNVAPGVQRVNNFEVLSYRSKLGIE
ncbi:MAG: hypothetical protein ACOH5I_09935 [Oligoflexus sp.]